VGLDHNGVRFLLQARASGVSFERTATLGRQSLDLSLPLLARVLHNAGQRDAWSTARRLLTASNGYADELFALLGCRELVAFDASPYEGAAVVHDFNQPLPREYYDRFTAVLDGGSLEHVFNFPTAIANLMRLPVLRGHYLGISPVNNFPGHGFYQFSPELFFRVLAPENGYSIRTMSLFEEGWMGGWKEVSDPATVRRRVTFVNRAPTYLAILAEKIADAVPFERSPLQSDYAAEWIDAARAPRGPSSSQSPWLRGVHKFIPGWLRNPRRYPPPLFSKRRREKPVR
jgi:hypothetical protein